MNSDGKVGCSVWTLVLKVGMSQEGELYKQKAAKSLELWMCGLDRLQVRSWAWNLVERKKSLDLGKVVGVVSTE